MYIAHGWLPLLSYDLVNTMGIECMGSARAYVLMSYVPGDIRHKTKYREGGCFIHIVEKETMQQQNVYMTQCSECKYSNVF